MKLIIAKLLLRVLGRIAISIGSKLPSDLDSSTGKDRLTGSKLGEAS
jgi:hypothetical protein